MSEKKERKYGRPIEEIISDLKEPLPDKCVATRNIQGKQIEYIPWHYVVEMLDWKAPGWSYEIKSIVPVDCQQKKKMFLFITVRISIPCAEGIVWREGTGFEEEGEKPIAYGDLSSNAESMAFRMAAAKFGLALYFYKKD